MIKLIIIIIIIIIIITKTFNKIDNIMNAGFFLKLTKKLIPSGKKTMFSNRKN